MISLPNNSPRPRVWLSDAEATPWALSTDRELLQVALRDWADVTTELRDAEFVHAVWWEPLLQLPSDVLRGKRIVCHFAGEPYRSLRQTRFRHVVARVGRWIAQSDQAAQQLTRIGLPFSMIPYTVDPQHFYRLPDSQRATLRSKYHLPNDAYLVGSFQRDSEGNNLTQPKLVKGPDLFVEALVAAQAAGVPVHAVLAGPRRHWVRAQMTQRRIPFTQIGGEFSHDDFPSNILPAATLNELYQLLDLYLISSRSEGGPRGILEGAVTGCPILSTPVGLARDILHPDCIATNIADAQQKIVADWQSRSLAQHATRHSEQVTLNHYPHAVARRFQAIYRERDAIKPHSATTPVSIQSKPRRWQRWIRRLAPTTFSNRLTVGWLHHDEGTPCGPDHHFMSALQRKLVAHGVHIIRNEIDPHIDAYLLDSTHIDPELLARWSTQRRVPVLHRIVGPTCPRRGYDTKSDDECFRLNRQFATATVLPSSSTYAEIVGRGYQPVSPVVVHHGADPDFFFPTRESHSHSNKIRLIMTSPSDNSDYEMPFCRWLEQHLDWSRFELTFVGEYPARLERTHVIPLAPSKQRADLLREHDIYVTASRYDARSAALIEAQACGLPALYRMDGGNLELVGHGGISFEGKNDCLVQLDRLANDYGSFRRLVQPPSLAKTVDAYLSLLRDLVATKHEQRTVTTEMALS